MIKISPLVRLAMTFDIELAIDSESVFDGDLRKGFIRRYEQAEAIRDNIMRLLFFSQSVLAVIVFGFSFKIPIVGLDTIQIPIIRECITFGVALTLMMTSIALVNVEAYHAIIRQFTLRDARPKGKIDAKIDPDFILAAETSHQLFLKVFAPKMNIWGDDVYESKALFKLASWVTFFMISIIFVFLMVLNYSIVGYSLWLSYDRYGIGFIPVVYYTIVSVTCIVSLMIYFIARAPFSFKTYGEGEGT